MIKYTGEGWPQAHERIADSLTNNKPVVVQAEVSENGASSYSLYTLGLCQLAGIPELLLQNQTKEFSDDDLLHNLAGTLKDRYQLTGKAIVLHPNSTIAVVEISSGQVLDVTFGQLWLKEEALIRCPLISVCWENVPMVLEILSIKSRSKTPVSVE